MRHTDRPTYRGGMLIAEDLLLLLYDDRTGKPITGSPGLDFALAGAVLIELTLQQKLDVTAKGRLQVLDGAPTGDPILDERLSYIVNRPGKKPKDQIKPLSKHLRDQLLTRLAQKGVLEADQGKLLGLFPVTRWPAKDARHELEVRTQLESVLTNGLAPDQRTAALIALLSALNVVPKVITDAVDKRELKQRAKEIADSDWAAAAVKKAVAEMQAAVTAAIIASTTAAS